MQVHNIQEVEIVEDVARTVPRIDDALEDCQVDHQSINNSLPSNLFLF